MGKSGVGGSPGGPKPPVDETTIRRWLQSKNLDLILQALAELDQLYRYKIGVWIIRKFGRLLQDADLPEIWDKVADAIIDMALKRKITDDGNLATLLYKLAYRNAVNVLRLRSHLCCRDIDALDDFIVNWDALLELQELLDAIREGIQQMPDDVRVVFEIRMEMFWANGYPPSIPELTTAFEEITKTSVSESTIRRKVKHGNSLLYSHLKRKGLIP